jgi:hypothetical protein
MDEDAKVTRSSFTRIVPILVLIALIIGIVLRMDGLATRTMDHIEIYVPGMHLPVELSNPPPRLSLRDSLVSPIVLEPRPPGYYVFMFAWTKCFGTSPFSIRLPSVLFDIGSIFLIFILGARVGLRHAGLLACFLWATGGLPIYLSQEARPNSFACFLGILATLLLIESYSALRFRRFTIVAYVLTILAGLVTSHFFWAILFVHMLYSLFGPIPRDRPVAVQARWQLLVLTLACPLFAVAVFQSGRPSYLSPKVWPELLGYLRLLFLGSRWGLLPANHPIPPWVGIAISFICAVILVIGIIKIRRTLAVECRENVGYPKGVLFVAAGLAFVVIEVFAYVTHQKHKMGSLSWLTERTWVIVACGAVPLLAVTADYILEWKGTAIRRLVSRFSALLCPAYLVVMLAVVPIAVLSAASLVVPVLAQRTAMYFGPYLMLILGAGALRLSRMRILRALVVSALLVLNVVGHLQYRKLHFHGPADYAALASQIEIKSKQDDLWFVFRHVRTTPMFYYLDFEKYNFVGRDYVEALENYPKARVWVLGFKWDPPPPRVTKPLADYRHSEQIRARGIYADLYIPAVLPSTRI